jgi:hypothetical protein
MTILLFMAILFSLSFSAWFKSETLYSDSERRGLQRFPELNAETLFSGSFTSSFETYTQDQFPLRDVFRKFKAIGAFNLFQKQDNNDIVIDGNSIYKLEYPLNEPMLDHAADKFESIYNTYLKDTDANVYFSIVPDKNYYLEENDFVTPYGSGKVADFEVFIEWDYNTGEKYIGMALDIRFNEPYAGYYVVEKDKFSNFQGVYSAETNRTYITTERFFTKLIGNNERKRHKFDNSKCWIVRSRCVVDNEGKLVSANYSIISDFLYGRDDDDRNVFCIRLYGYFNPIPNDTNLEHKVQRWDYNGGEIMDKYY